MSSRVQLPEVARLLFRGRMRWVVLMIVAAALASWWLGPDAARSVASALGLEPILTRTVGAPRVTTTSSSRPVDLVVEALRPDTKRTDRWRLRLPEAYVTATLPKTTRENTNVYHIDLVFGSMEPATVFLERNRERLAAEPEISADYPRRSLILVSVGGVVGRQPLDLARYRFASFAPCQKITTAYDGLIKLEMPADESKGICPRQSGTPKAIFAAGGQPGRYDILIVCHYRNAVLDYCGVDLLVLKGWAVRIPRFDVKHLGDWRGVVRQVVTLLEQHTIESTTGLPSSDLSWL